MPDMESVYCRESSSATCIMQGLAQGNTSNPDTKTQRPLAIWLPCALCYWPSWSQMLRQELAPPWTPVQSFPTASIVPSTTSPNMPTSIGMLSWLKTTWLRPPELRNGKAGVHRRQLLFQRAGKHANSPRPGAEGHDRGWKVHQRPLAEPQRAINISLKQPKCCFCFCLKGA